MALQHAPEQESRAIPHTNPQASQAPSHRPSAATIPTPPANLSRRTGHLREDLQQIAMLGIILAACRYANGEVHHVLRDRGFLIKVPPSLLKLQARGRKQQGPDRAAVSHGAQAASLERRTESAIASGHDQPPAHQKPPGGDPEPAG